MSAALKKRDLDAMLADAARVQRAMTEHEKPYIEQLKQIGQLIGFGRACQILGDQWDAYLEQEYGQGAGRRGSMERRPDIELVEMLMAQRDEARIACGEWQTRCHELRAKQDGKA